MSDGQLPAASPTAPEELTPRTFRLLETILREGISPHTRRAYRGDLRYFWAWARVAQGLEESYPVPVPVLVEFCVQHLSEEGPDPAVDGELVAAGVKRKPGRHAHATVARRIEALAAVHRAQGLADADNPARHHTVRTILRRAKKGDLRRGRTPRRAKALTQDLLEALLVNCRGHELADLRDRAMLLLAWASGGRRRSEVSAVRIEHLEKVPDGYLLTLPRDKTHQEGDVPAVPVLGRAACAVDDWLEAAGLQEGALFRPIDRHGNIADAPLSPWGVDYVVSRRAELAGLGETVSAHGLRSGFLTECGRRGVSLSDAMALSGHRSVPVALRYIRSGSVLNNPAARLAA